MSEGVGGGGRYRAFLSYSHRDAAVAGWLHRRLEGYRVPRRLAWTQGEHGPVPARLTPIFRDREELPAAGDLSEKVRAALALSDHLIVLCSPNAAASQWVAKEVAAYRELHPGRPVFAAIVEGEPPHCFPAGLAEGAVEPLAADLRPGRDGRRLGVLKLVAGLAGVGLDALVQRDAQRRMRRVMGVTAVAVAAMLVMAVMTVIALNARADAQRQRAEAEGLVEFMLTDLRRELKGAAGLKVLTAASGRALAYYRDQDLDGLPPESLERRARILHALGEDDIRRADLDGALRRFQQAARTTSRLMEKEPGSQQRIFAHAQSEFWIGHVDHSRRDYAAARAAFQRYKLLAERLVAAAPANPDWRAELAYAEGNLCTVEHDSNGDLDSALRSCTVALRAMEAAARTSGKPDYTSAVPNRYGWLADVYRRRGDVAAAWALRQRQERILTAMREKEPDNLDLSEMWLTNQFSIAELESQRRQTSAARARLEAALALAQALVRSDPENATWASRRKRISDDLAKLKH
jgi:hypothetical protein